jgi:hypothetical protein
MGNLIVCDTPPADKLLEKASVQVHREHRVSTEIHREDKGLFSVNLCIFSAPSVNLHFYYLVVATSGR